MKIQILNSPEEIARAYKIFLELRPFLPDVQNFVNQVIDQQKEGYKIAAIWLDSEIVAAAGFRIMKMLVSGKILYIDDLITAEKNRGNGYGKALLDYVANVALSEKCNQIHLDMGYERHNAHRLYISHGFKFHCHHMTLEVK